MRGLSCTGPPVSLRNSVTIPDWAANLAVRPGLEVLLERQVGLVEVAQAEDDLADVAVGLVGRLGERVTCSAVSASP